MMSDNHILRGRDLRIVVEITVLILLIVSIAGSATTIWDESSGSPLPFIWNYTNFDGFNVSGTGSENLTILQTNLSASQRTIEKGNLTYTTTLQAKKLNVVEALNLTNSEDMANKGLERAYPGQAFENGQYYILNWQAQEYIPINRKIFKLAKKVIDQGTLEKKTLKTGETWDIGDGWALTALSVNTIASPKLVWLTLSKDGIKKDDKIITSNSEGGIPIYTYVGKNIAGEMDIPILVTYVESIFSGKTSDLVQLKYTWAVSTSVTEINSGNVYGELEVADISYDTLTLNNNNSINLDSNRTVNLMGNLRFNVIDNTTSLKFYPIIEPELSVAAPSVEITAGVPANIEFTVAANGSPVADATVNLSGAALGGGVTDANGKVTINVNASYIGKIAVEAEKQGYAKGINMLQAAYSVPSNAMASWNLQENYTLNLVDIDAKSYIPQARLQLLKNNKAVDDIIIHEGQKYYYNSSNFTIFTAAINEIFIGTKGNLVELVNASQNSGIDGSDLLIKSSHLFESGNFTGIDWQLNESYNLRMMDIDVYSYPRKVWLALLKSDAIIDHALLSPGQTYTYTNTTNSKVLDVTIDAIFYGTQGNLVKLKNVTQYSETSGIPLISNEIHLYKSGNFNGVGWKLNESYELRMMDIDIKASPRQVWFELLKDNITKDDSILSYGWFSNYTYFYNVSGNTILTGKVDMIFKDETFNLVRLIDFYQKSDTDASILINNATHSFVYGDVNGINQTLFETYTLSLLGIDMNVTPRLVWLGIYKNNTPVDDKIVWEDRSFFSYWENITFSYYNATNALTLIARVDAVFAGATGNCAKLIITQYSEIDRSILADNATYIFCRNGSAAGGGDSKGNGITYPTNNSVFEYGEMIMLSGNASFGAPPYTYKWGSSIDGSIGSASKILIYSLSPGTHVITFNITDINGNSAVSSRKITISAVNTSIVPGANATGPMTWNASSFPAFWQEGGNTSEALSVAAISGERNISKGDLYYNITRQLTPYRVYSLTGKTVDYGLDPVGNKIPSGSHYAKIGFFGRPYAAIGGKANKLAKLILEQNETSSKTLSAGQTWDMGDGWTLIANSIDAKATPKQVWLTLSKDGIKKDDKVNVEGDVYVYVEKSFAGESDVPLFAAYIDNISVGATGDLARLKYAWLVSGNPIVLNSGDNIGILKAIETVNTEVTMSNSYHNMTLNRGSMIDIAGGLRFRVNDTPTLDYYPEMGLDAGMVLLSVDASGGGDYTKIQDAINNASDGNTILVYSGTYFENVDINKRLILKGIDSGSGKPVVDAKGFSNAIVMSAGNSTLEGFKIINGMSAGILVNSSNNMIRSNNASNSFDGIFLYDSGNNTLSNNNISQNIYGISLQSSSNNTLNNNDAMNNSIGISLIGSRNNTLTSNTMTDNMHNFELWGNYDNQIDTTNLVNEKPVYYIKDSVNTVYDNSTNAGTFYCINCINVTIQDMNLSDSDAGIFFWKTNLSNIQNVKVSNNSNGIYLGYSSNNMLNNIKASNNYDGIVLISSSNNVLKNNQVSNNGDGISLLSSANNSVIENNVMNNSIGIYLGSSNNNTLSSNIISNNNIFGISLRIFPSNNNTIFNNFFNNTNNFVINNSTNTWNSTRIAGTNIIGGYYIGGNFWAYPNSTGFSQTCADNNNDGICDLSYALDSNNTDYIPLVYKITPTPTPNNGGGNSGSSGGSSGGGGGGGGTSGENFSNIEIKEKHDLHIFKDKITSYAFTSKGNPILFINITGNISAGEINTAVEVLRNTSTLVKIQAPGIVYKNTNVWVGTSGFAGPKNIKEAIIRFKVENKWLDGNNLAINDVKLVRWDGSKWIELETTEKIKDGMYTHFETKTYSFSHFAITGVKGEDKTVAIPAIQTTKTPEPTLTSTSVQSKGTPGFEVIIAITTLSSVYILRRRINIKR